MSYFDSDAISSSEIACFLNCPTTWYHRYRLRDWKSEPTASMEFGTQVHRMLELGRLPEVKQIPAEVLNRDGHCKGKAWTDWKDANPADAYCKPGETSPLQIIWEHVQASTFCRVAVEDGEKEVEHVWDEPGVGKCKVKFDVIECGSIIDWKTTSTKTERVFVRDIIDMHYDVRLAFYRWGYRARYGCTPNAVYVVAIETTEGYNVRPYRLSDEWLDDAEARLLLALEAMQSFDMQSHLDSLPVEIKQPAWSTVNFEEISE